MIFFPYPKYSQILPHILTYPILSYFLPNKKYKNKSKQINH